MQLSIRLRWLLISLLMASLTAAEAVAVPELVDPVDGSLTLVTPSPAEQAKLDQVDGLAFDAFGNLMAVRQAPRTDP